MIQKENKNFRKMFIVQGRRRRSGRTASAGPLFLDEYAFRRVPFFSFWLIFLCAYITSDFQFIDAIINNARCACHP